MGKRQVEGQQPEYRPGECENISMTEEKQGVRESVRLVRWRMTHENIRFADEFRIIPRWIKVLAVTLFIAGQGLAVFTHLNGGEARVGVRMGFMAAVTLVVGFVLQLFGYVNRDAKRRG